MNLFIQYIKQRRRGIFVGAVFSIIFLVTFTMYRLPIKAVLYPVGLCVVLGVALMLKDMYRVRKKHEKLVRIHKLTDAEADAFPEVDSIEDADYQNIIRQLCAEQRDFRTETSCQYADMVAYYTVWAHQIKTPIASMRLNLQNEDSALSRQLSGDLFRIEQYVEMVLMYLRLESTSTDYVIRAYDLDTIIRQAVKKFASEFISRKLKLVYEPVHETVITDEKWLLFVLEQVLSNALKYTSSGSITITLTPDKQLRIQDTGIGIAPEDLPRVFENGYTGYNGRMDKKASGIGLYLCKRICDNLGHGIWVESVVGEGTCVIIDLHKDDLTVE